MEKARSALVTSFTRPAQEERVVFLDQIDILAGQLLSELAIGQVDAIVRQKPAGPHGQVVIQLGSVLLPDDQGGFSRSFAVHQHFTGAYGGDFGEASQADGHALHRKGTVEQHGFADGQVQRP